MSPRSVRRAAARQAQKLARKAEKAAVPSHNEPETQPRPQEAVSSSVISPARLAANQKNAQLSTGPPVTQGRRPPASTQSKPD